MSRKTLYFDVETTGLDPARHGLIQLACLVDIDGTIVDESSWHIKPFRGDLISKEATEVTGISREDLESFPNPEAIYPEIIELFSKHVDKFDRTDKFYPAGYNVRFDMGFLKQFFEKNKDVYFGSWFNGKCIDPLSLLHWMDWSGEISLPDYKLVSVCNHFGIELGDMAHDALADVRATRELILKLVKL